jgi:asparagine synthase (glutamine-hydrolysing)
MANSLEVRVPLLDQCLVEAVLQLPPDAHGGSSSKPLLTAALNGLLPARITERRDKQGFVFPFDRWMRGPLQGQLETWFDSSGGQPWVRPETARAVWNQYETGRAHWSRPWALAILQSGLVISP